LPGGNAESVADVEAYARAALRRHAAPRCLIVLDYLQRMAYRGRYADLRENVSELSLRLRELAGHLDSPVLALSSLSRQIADLDHPTLEALKESGDLEYAADVVLLLGARKEPTLGSAARARATGGARLLDLLVAKNRYGEADYRVPLLFNAPIGSSAKRRRSDGAHRARPHRRRAPAAEGSAAYRPAPDPSLAALADPGRPGGPERRRRPGPGTPPARADRHPLLRVQGAGPGRPRRRDHDPRRRDPGDVPGRGDAHFETPRADVPRPGLVLCSRARASP